MCVWKVKTTYRHFTIKLLFAIEIKIDKLLEPMEKITNFFRTHVYRYFDIFCIVRAETKI